MDNYYLEFFRKSSDWDSNNLPFESKEEYIKWRSEWKQNYRKLSECIRKHKNSNKRKVSFSYSSAHSLGINIGSIKHDAAMQASEEYQKLKNEDLDTLNELFEVMKLIVPKLSSKSFMVIYHASNLATLMLELRRMSKKKAGELMMKKKVV